MKQKTAIVIGAGYGGLATANLLAKGGYAVTVLEKNSTAGGRIAAIKKDGFLFDLGPSWYLMPEVFEQFYSLFEQSATERLDLIRFQPGYKVFFDRQPPLVVNGDVDVDRDLFESIEDGAGVALDRYVARSTETYEMATKYFLYNNFRRWRDFFKWPIIRRAPQMLALTLRPLDAYVSRHFRDQRLKQLLEYHMVFLGSSPFQAPAIYSLMSHLDFRSGVYYPRRGMLSLIDDMIQLGREYSIEYRFDSPVQRITVEEGRAVGVELSDGAVVKADIVVSNADLHHTETKLLDRQHQSYPESYWQRRQPGPGAFLLSLGVEGLLPELQHHNLYFVDDWRKNFDDIYVNQQLPEQASMYVCNPTKTDPGLAPDNHENLFVLLPMPAGLDLSNQESAELADKVIAILADKLQVSNLAERIVTRHIYRPGDFGADFNAWQFNAFGGESHLLRQSVIFRTGNVSRKVKNLYYVGAGTLPGIGLPMCLIGAQLTYKRIIGDDSAGPLRAEGWK